VFRRSNRHKQISKEISKLKLKYVEIFSMNMGIATNFAAVKFG
jgi:hypothetical protein